MQKLCREVPTFSMKTINKQRQGQHLKLHRSQ